MLPAKDTATLMPRISAILSRPVSAQSLAMFRIFLGALLVWDCWRFFKYDRIWRYWVEPDFHFTYAGFDWVVPLPEPWIHIAWGMMGIAAFCVMLGLFYRVSVIMLTIGFGYFFLLDKAEYLNHFYLVLLFLILMCFLPAQRMLSLDTWLFPSQRREHIPYVTVFLIRAQTEIMLLFAGIVKLTPDWLAGEPLGLWLRDQADLHPLGFLFHYDWVIIAGTWGTVALHLIGAPLLLWNKTRLWVFGAYGIFHIANAGFFNIGIFPWLTIAATTIFFAPDWPQRFARYLLSRFEQLPELPLAPRTAGRPIPRSALLALAGWLVIQIVLPMRAWFIPSEVRWSGDGHRFSWRMRIYDRQATGVFIVRAEGREWVVDPAGYLTERQAGKMLVRPDMILQFAHHLGTVWREAGYDELSVHAKIQKSLNGREPQYFVDPAVDLLSAPVAMLSADPWIVPLDEQIRGVWEN